MGHGLDVGPHNLKKHYNLRQTLLQSAQAYKYYKMRKLDLLQNAAIVVTKCRYYKMPQNEPIRRHNYLHVIRMALPKGGNFAQKNRINYSN